MPANIRNNILEEIYKKEQNKMSKYELIKAKLNEFSTNTTTHGVPSCARTMRLPIRIMWFVFIMISSAACVYFVFTTVQSYLKYEVVSQIRVIPNRPMPYPLMTICNANLFPTEYGDQFVNEYLKNASIMSQIDLDSLNLKARFLSYYIMMNVNVLDDELKQKIGYSKEEFIIDCIVDGIDCTDQIKWIFTVNNGNCFQLNFNISSPMSQTTVGQHYALFLTIRFGSEYEHELMRDRGVYIIFTEHGQDIRYAEGEYVCKFKSIK
jgi:hypothetical protein